MSDVRERAERALNKPATFGPDIDLSKFSRKTKAVEPCPISQLPREVINQAYQVGVKADEKDRAGTYFQMNHSAKFPRSR